MSSCTNAQLSDQQNNASLHSNEEEEDEEEDVDFNPFLKGTPSPDASSSLSSEIEDLDGNSSKQVVNDMQNYDVEYGEEVVTQNAQATCADSGNDVQVHQKCMKRKSNCDENVQVNADNDETLDGEDEDAIWKRTRARYSLASFTLEELETFLQETDDEDDLQNVDDEEEYRKFLAAVLQGGDGDGQSAQDDENADDEDNDADFEIELEELLESDVDDSKRNTDQKLENERSARRPETRQNKRQRASSQYKKKLLEQTKRPLRPLLPIYPNGPVASLPSADGRVLTTEIGATYLPSTSGHGLINGFTPNQIGQLHCLLYEHVQLLIQVLSLCIHDPSRRQIASQVQELIYEMLNKRDEMVACRSVSYPDICFHPSNMRPSVMDEIPNLRPPQCSESSSAPNMHAIVTEGIPTTMGKNAHAFNGQINASQTAGSFWVPFVNGPLVSILDVAPLSLVGSYMDEVFTAVREYRQRHLDSGCDTLNEREPLFQLPHFPSGAETNGEVLIGNMPPTVSAVPSAPGQRPPKKTLAASIVENVKKQSVALVPKDICKLAQRFFQLFNPSLFPHKPPPAAVANRVLFTDSEDELLALGMMEYNTDWKAIQQRFLPCKSKHQIFVRQKNRCSSKAPENPIKTIRRMKTSALTAEEIERIQEGLRVLKHDWMSVWRFIVPHRDPSLLPRQWRIALGTQKSYKLDAAKKEKRRIYESNRRRCKTADLANWQQDNQVDSIGGENNSRDDYVDNPNEAYVHQAFLADWRPDASNVISSPHPSLNIGDGSLPFGSLPREDIHIMNQSHITHIHGFPYAHYYQYSHNIRHFPSNSVKLNNQVTGTTQDAGESSSHLWPYRTRRTDGAHLVKLAPDLPPVNLPPTVRVISQAAFRSNQNGVSKKAPSPGDRTGDVRKENLVPQLPLVANSTSTCLTTSKGDGSNQVRENIANSCPEDRTSSHPEESATLHDANGAEERGTESDLHMHPLLFQSSEDGHISYYPLSCTTGASSSFSFFSANQPQLNLSLFHSPNPGRNFAGSLNKSSKTMKSSSVSCGIDFHPLLQRTEEENNDSAATCSNTHKCEGLGTKSDHFQNSSAPVNSGSSATVTKSSCPIEKANELDLEIHLSSTSIVDQTRGTSLVGTSNDAKSLANMSSGNTIVKHKSKRPFHQHFESCPMDEGNLVSAADSSAVPNDNDDRCDMDDIGDQSPAEIVMEQEELSDSDEETEEDVQFECEEMADSDGDEDLDCDSIAEVQNKECLNHATEVTTNAVYGDKQCEWKNPVHTPSSTSVETECSPILKMNLTSFGKDSTNSSWLTLDSSASIDPPSMKAKQGECLIGSSPDAKNLASRRPNRSYKRTTPSSRSGASFKNVDRAQQLGLDLLAVSTLKKPRKRPSRSNTERTNEKPSYDQDKGS